jgi:hypothetical protein
MPVESIKNISNSILTISKQNIASSRDAALMTRDATLRPGDEVVLYDFVAENLVSLRDLISQGRVEVVSTEQPEDAPTVGIPGFGVGGGVTSIRVRATYADVIAGDFANPVQATVLLTTLPAGASVLYAKIKTAVPFSGGTVASVQALVCLDTNGTVPLTGGNLDVSASAGPTHQVMTGFLSPLNTEAENPVYLLIQELTAQDLHQLVAGEVDVWISYIVQSLTDTIVTVPPPLPPPPLSSPHTFLFTGAPQSFIVPDGITSVTVDAVGAASHGNVWGDIGSVGGRAQGTLTVTPGETLNLYVGGAGGGAGDGIGGWNGGGNAATGWLAAGGGASDIRQGGTAIADRVIVAGGAGGPAVGSFPNEISGGVGGGLIGGSDGLGRTTGGTQSAGGISGADGGTNGSLGLGGNGGNPDPELGPGGGGGYYGGGAGGFISGLNSNASGGGGSSLIPAGGSTTSGYGALAADGYIILSW